MRSSFRSQRNSFFESNESHSRSRAPELISVDQFADYDTAKLAKIIRIQSFDNEADWHWLSQHYLSHRPNDSQPTNDLVVYAGGIENSPELIAHAERQTRVAGNSSQTLEKLLDKYALFERLQKAGLDVPVWGTANQIDSLIEKFGEQGVLQKDLKSCGGLRVGYFSKATQHSIDSSMDVGWYQQFVPGRPLSAVYVAWNSGRVHQARRIGASIQLIGDSDFHSSGFKYTGSITCDLLGSLDSGEPLSEAIDRLAFFLVQQYGLVGLFNIDFVYDDHRVYFLEINPRYSASMELFERAHDINLFELQLAATLPDLAAQPESLSISKKIDALLGTEPNPKPIYGKAIWYAQRPYDVSTEFSEFAWRQIDSTGFPIIADIPMPKTKIEKGSPMFTVYAKGDTEKTVREKLIKTAKMFDSKIHQESDQ